jgi:hypothetical protein
MRGQEQMLLLQGLSTRDHLIVALIGWRSPLITVHEFRVATNELLEDARLGNWNSLQSDLQRVISFNRQLVLYLYEYEMYASVEAVRLAVSVRQRIQTMQGIPMPDLPSNIGPPEAQIRNEVLSIEPTLKSMEPDLLKLEASLVGDVRVHLGLSKL